MLWAIPRRAFDRSPRGLSSAHGLTHSHSHSHSHTPHSHPSVWKSFLCTSQASARFAHPAARCLLLTQPMFTTLLSPATATWLRCAANTMMVDNHAALESHRRHVHSLTFLFAVAVLHRSRGRRSTVPATALRRSRRPPIRLRWTTGCRRRVGKRC